MVGSWERTIRGGQFYTLVEKVNEMAAVWDHPQLAARQRWTEVATPAGPMPALRPITGDGWTPRMDPVPGLGEHTAQILAELGCDADAMS